MVYFRSFEINHHYSQESHAWHVLEFSFWRRIAEHKALLAQKKIFFDFLTFGVLWNIFVNSDVYDLWNAVEICLLLWDLTNPQASVTGWGIPWRMRISK